MLMIETEYTANQ